MATNSAASLVTRMRLKRELSMNSFAELVGVPASTITRIEAGVVDPTYSMLQKIAVGAGFTLQGNLADTGSDAPYAEAIDRIRAAPGSEKRRLVKKLAQTANLALVTKRPGVRIFALDTTLEELIHNLLQRGANPIISSLEAVSGDAISARSFTPIVYVERPDVLDDLPAMSSTAKSSIVILPITENVRRFTVFVNGARMMIPEWGMLDALASPGRQADVARELLPQFASRVEVAEPADQPVAA
jgi:transcriptional regulator with XRE-family HTH domain